MAHGRDYINFILEDRDKVKDFVAKVSSQMLYSS